MAFTYTYNSTPRVIGNLRKRSGTYTNTAGSTGGAITTGLNFVESFSTNCTSHVGASQPKVTIAAGGSVTILTSADTLGQWWAEGI